MLRSVLLSEALLCQTRRALLLIQTRWVPNHFSISHALANITGKKGLSPPRAPEKGPGSHGFGFVHCGQETKRQINLMLHCTANSFLAERGGLPVLLLRRRRLASRWRKLRSKKNSREEKDRPRIARGKRKTRTYKRPMPPPNSVWIQRDGDPKDPRCAPAQYIISTGDSVKVDVLRAYVMELVQKQRVDGLVWDDIELREKTSSLSEYFSFFFSCHK